MKNPLKPKFLPWFTLGAGGAGLALRIWLFSATDEKGLLPASHPAIMLTFVLTAIILAVLALGVRPLIPISRYSRLFPASVLRTAGCAAGAAGILCAVISETNFGDLITVLSLILGILGAVCLLYMGYCRFKGLHPSYLFPAAVTAYLMLHAVSQVRTWGSETQLAVYFFPLLASIFLMLTAYYQTVLAVKKGSRRWFVFCSQAALFFCCLSFNSDNKLFYIGMALWTLADICALYTKPPRYIRQPENA